MKIREKVDENGGSMIIITLETGLSVTPENKRQAAFREIMGKPSILSVKLRKSAVYILAFFWLLVKGLYNFFVFSQSIKYLQILTRDGKLFDDKKCFRVI